MLDWRELDPQRLAGYWLAKVANGIEDYYSGEGESAGEWHGAGAQALGLHGRVDADDLTAVLRSEYGELQTMSNRTGPGVSPYSGGTRTVRRRPGWDFCLKAPKSVSLLYAFGDKRVRGEVLAAHEAATKATLDYAERHMTRTRRTIDGERRHVPGRGLICALFRHRTSRAGDPQLHTHALIANATRDDRGRWLRINAPWLLGPSKTLGYLYQAQLRAELTRRIGVEWEPVHRGYSDVRGVPRETVEAFSRRRIEILELLDARGQHPEQAKAAQQAAYDTRRAKDRSLAPKPIREEWRRYGREVGLDEAELLKSVGRQSGARPGSAAELRRVVKELVAEQGIVREASSATEHEIVRTICERLPNGADLGSVEACTEAIRASKELVRLDPPSRDERVTELRPEGARYTTRGLLATEQELIDAAVGGQGSGAAVPGREVVEATLSDARWSLLKPEQERMVRALAQRGDRLAVVRGDAGTGKTFALGAYREVIENAGWTVVGAANTRRAAAELGEVGIPSTSIAATLADLRRYPELGLRPRAVLIVDEAGTASTWDVAALLREVERANGKLVLVGDPRQLGAIGPGGAFRSLLERLPPIELKEVLRQRLLTDREAIAAQRGDRFGEALGVYAAEGRVEVCESPFLTRAAVVEGWARDGDPERSLMLARTNRDANYLNAAARSQLEDSGRFSGETVDVANQPFQRGDLLITRARAYALGVRNQDRWRVVAVGADELTVDVERLSDGHRAHLDAAYLRSTGWSGVPAIQHGYAGTIAITQGTTIDRVHVLLDGGLDARDVYTATTRSRKETRLYLTDAAVRERSDTQPEPERDIRDPYEGVLRAVDRTRPDFAADEERHRQDARRMSDRELHRRAETLTRLQSARSSANVRPHAIKEARAQPSRVSLRLIRERQAELAAVAEEIGARQRAELAVARRLQPPWVERSVGAMPEAPAERLGWERQLGAIVSYRQRFGVRDQQRALGVSPRSRDQAAARRRVEQALHTAHRAEANRQVAIAPERTSLEMSL